MNKAIALAALAATVVALAGCGGSDEKGAPALNGAVPFDRAFIDAMVPHHRGAVEMARVARRAGLTQPDLIRIADAVIATQQDEIDDMLRWREQWYGGEPESEEEAVAALGLTREEAGMAHDPATVEDTTDVDQAFASMMVAHHEGAIRMAELARDHADHVEVRELAKAIITAQRREIEIMKPHTQGEEHHG